MMFGEVALKLAISFAVLWLLTRLVGKKEISQLTPFDFISSLMLSEIVGNTLYQEDTGVPMLVFALVFWGLLTFLFNKLTMKFKGLRKPLEGEPTLLISKGDVNVRELRRNNLDFDQLTMMLRQKDIFSVREVDYAIYENNGSLSVIKRPAPDGGNEGGESDFSEPAYCVVEDGKVREDMLRKLGLSRSWLLEQLEAQGFPEARLPMIAYAEWKETEGIYILTK